MTWPVTGPSASAAWALVTSVGRGHHATRFDVRFDHLCLTPRSEFAYKAVRPPSLSLPQSPLSLALPLPSLMDLVSRVLPALAVLLVLGAFLLSRQLSVKDIHPTPMTPYTFSARAPIRQGKTTYLQFAAPSPPHKHGVLPPTILQTLDTFNVVGRRTRCVSQSLSPTRILNSCSVPVRQMMMT